MAVFCLLEKNDAGPLHEYNEAPTALALKRISPPAQAWVMAIVGFTTFTFTASQVKLLWPHTLTDLTQT
jgi:hypothetical protein